jgi:uncharacterized protein YndB with AHSA1/START domain
MSKFVYVTYIRTTPERLWDTLTKPEFTKLYWCGTSHESSWEKGADWRIMIPDGRVGDAGKILEIEPGRRLVLSWRNEFMPALKAEGFSRASFEIEKVGDTVRLTVTQEIDRDPSQLIDGVSNGWPAILSSLKTFLETGTALEMTSRWPEGL